MSLPKCFLLLLLIPLLTQIGCGEGQVSQAELLEMAKAKAEAKKAIEADLAKKKAAKAKEKAEKEANKPAEAASDNNESASPAASKPEVPTVSAPASTTANTPAVQKTKAPSYQPYWGKPGTGKPIVALSPADARKRTIDNLNTIAAALYKYEADKKHLPRSASYEPDSTNKLLSWRVALLPYLGHKALYDKFNLKKPWDHPDNKKLLAEIPAAYQSPERFDTNTNYLVPNGRNAAFNNGAKISSGYITDDKSSTILVMEADESRAVPWTAPQELPFDLGTPISGVSGLRAEGCFVIWADSSVGILPAAAGPQDILSRVTINQGEPTDIISQAPSIVAPAVAATNNPSQNATSNNAGANTPAVAPAAVRNQVVQQPVRQMQPIGVAPARKPVPDKVQKFRATQQFKELYQDEYTAAKTPQQKNGLAKKLFDLVDEVTEDPASLYVLLDITSKIAAQSGDFELTMQVVERMAFEFNVVREEILLDTMRDLAKAVSGSQAIQVAEDLFVLQEERFESGDYDRANGFLELIRTALSGELEGRKFKTQIEDAERALLLVQKAEQAILVLEKNPNDSKAKTSLGEHLCFIKNDWENGLAILATIHDGKLTEIAEQEQAMPTDSEKQVALGQAWWKYAERAEAVYQESIRMRAIMWYQKALPTLPKGFQRVLIEKQIAEFNEEFKLTSR